jgi:glycosyltransferase involved in cell wall biosynthesis
MQVTPSFLPEKIATQDGEEKKSVEPTAHDRPFFLFVGRLEHIKGAQDLMPAFGDDAPADLLIVGSGNYETELKEMAGDSRHIHFLGWKEPEQIKALYQQAIAVIIPSICYEVFPLVLLEAIREGSPVIARALGPFPELVNKSGAGLLFDSNDQLKQSIKSLATDTVLRETMAQAGLDAYKKYWSETIAMKNYFILIKSIAEKRGMDDLSDAISL